jgi:riboflavin synthase
LKAITLDPPNSKIFTFSLPPDFKQLIVHKGYVTLDGVSLTVTNVNVENAEFTVMLIPHTLCRVIMAEKPIGYQANLEVDVIGKYVQSGICAQLENKQSDVYKALENMIKNIAVKD